MLDRLLAIALNGVILGLIAALSAAALIYTHGAALRLFEGGFESGLRSLAAAVALGVGAAFTIRYRNDLADR